MTQTWPALIDQVVTVLDVVHCYVSLAFVAYTRTRVMCLDPVLVDCRWRRPLDYIQGTAYWLGFATMQLVKPDTRAPRPRAMSLQRCRSSRSSSGDQTRTCGAKPNGKHAAADPGRPVDKSQQLRHRRYRLLSLSFFFPFLLSTFFFEWG